MPFYQQSPGHAQFLTRAFYEETAAVDNGGIAVRGWDYPFSALGCSGDQQSRNGGRRLL